MHQLNKILSSESLTDFFDLALDPKGDWANVSMIDHTTAAQLSLYKKSGVPVGSTADDVPWIQGRQEVVFTRGCHKSVLEHINVFRKEFIDIIKRN